MRRFFLQLLAQFVGSLLAFAALVLILAYFANGASAAGFVQADDSGGTSIANGGQNVHADDRSLIYEDPTEHLTDVTFRIQNLGTGTCTATVSRANAYTTQSNFSAILDPPDISPNEIVDLTYTFTGTIDLDDVTAYYPYTTDDNWSGSGGTCARNVFLSSSNTIGTNAETRWVTLTKDAVMSVNWGGSLDYCGDNACTTGEDWESCAEDCLITTAYLPADEATYQAVPSAPVFVSSPVCSTDYPDADVYGWQCYDYDASGWVEWGCKMMVFDSLTATQDCPAGVYSYGAFFDKFAPVSVAENWRVRFQTVVSYDGDTYTGDEVSRQFDLVSGFETPDGGDVSWNASGWLAFFADQYDLRPSCEIFGVDFNGLWDVDFTGTGLSCVWDWLLFMIIPPADSFMDLLSQVWDKFSTRWPLAYVLRPVDSLVRGLVFGEACPLPTLPETDLEVAVVPEITPCTYVTQAAGYFAADSVFQGIGVILVGLLTLFATITLIKRKVISF